MRFDDVKQRGVHCKELGPNVGVSMAPTATYDELVEEGIKYFFSYKENAAGVASREYFWQMGKEASCPTPCKAAHGFWQIIYTCMACSHQRLGYSMYK